jgi:DNA-directed RNA polymerase subunit RPC12/RpoP
VKCSACSQDIKYPERQDGKCPKCGHRFVFEPRSGDKLTDAAFDAAINRVSSMGSVKWTKDNLYYEIARKTRPGSKLGSAVLAIIGTCLFFVGLLAPLFVLFGLVLWAVAFYKWPSVKIALTRAEFEALFNRWVAVNKDPKGLIVRKLEPAVPSRKGKLAPDLGGYSFDRAVITDRRETADLLLANNFHFENNCAVLCVDGYPERAFDTVRAMLRKNKKLVVYVLHDVTVDGCLLARRLAESKEWFKDRARVVDVGLRPGHAGPFKGCWQLQSGTVMPQQELSAGEYKWLSQYTLELAVIRPEQVIKRLFRALSNKEQGDVSADGGGGDVFVDLSAFSDDASASDGGGDSFG